MRHAARSGFFAESPCYQFRQGIQRFSFIFAPRFDGDFGAHLARRHALHNLSVDFKLFLFGRHGVAPQKEKLGPNHFHAFGAGGEGRRNTLGSGDVGCQFDTRNSLSTCRPATKSSTQNRALQTRRIDASFRIAELGGGLAAGVTTG
jgi:hypothetical protein